MEDEPRQEYLEAIYGLVEDGGEASTGAIAKALDVKPGSVTEMLRKLDREGYVTYRPYARVELTGKGLKEAVNVKRKHRLLERFLHDVLKVGKDSVHRQACLMEHGLSDDAADALNRFLGSPKRCPDDGKRIPAALKGRTASLAELPGGSAGVVASLDGGADFKERVRGIGLTEGRSVTVVAKEPFGGPVVVKAGNSRVTVGRGMASKIMVMT